MASNSRTEEAKTRAHSIHWDGVTEQCEKYMHSGRLTIRTPFNVAAAGDVWAHGTCKYTYVCKCSSTYQQATRSTQNLQTPRLPPVAAAQVRSAGLHGRVQCRCKCAALQKLLREDTDPRRDPLQERGLLLGNHGWVAWVLHTTVKARMRNQNNLERLAQELLLKMP